MNNSRGSVPWTRARVCSSEIEPQLGRRSIGDREGVWGPENKLRSRGGGGCDEPAFRGRIERGSTGGERDGADLGWVGEGRSWVEMAAGSSIHGGSGSGSVRCKWDRTAEQAAARRRGSTAVRFMEDQADEKGRRPIQCEGLNLIG